MKIIKLRKTDMSTSDKSKDINDFVGNTGHEDPTTAFIKRKKAVDDGSYHAAIAADRRLTERETNEEYT
jgi:hypothetical protein